MNWLVSVIIGHLLNALGFVLNKVGLDVAIKNAGAFTFYIGALGALSVVLFPLGAFWPQGVEQWLPLIIGGLFFMIALLCFMYALSMNDASRVAPFIGAMVPIFTFAFEYAWIGTTLSGTLLLAFVILIIGTIVVTVDVDAEDSGKKRSMNMKQLMPWILGVGAGAAFGLSFVASKIAYTDQPFWGAFVWMRLVSLVSVLFLLFSPTIRKAVFQARHVFATKGGAIYLASQIVGAAAFIFINYAISQASVSLVNALQGIQYAFLILIVLIGHFVAPKMVQEAMSKKSLAIRSVGVVVIAVGLALVAYQ